MISTDLREVADRLAIAHLTAVIDRAVDDKDWQRFRSCFTDFVSVDIGAVSGDHVVAMPLDMFVAEIAAINPKEKSSYHSHSNALIACDGDHATLTAHSYGWNLCPALTPPLYEVWGMMHYRFHRTNEGWKATYIRTTKLREAGDPSVSSWRAPQ